MTRYATLIFISLFCCRCENAITDPEPGAADLSATVSGTLAGGSGEFLTFLYLPRLRGNLNPDGYLAQGARLDDSETFRFTIDTVTYGGNYGIGFKDAFLRVDLFPGDDITLDLAADWADETIVAAGTGAGKINFQRLPQLEHDKTVYDPRTPDEFADRADSVHAARLALLEAVRAGDPDAEPIVAAANREDLERLIERTPLSAAEYDYLRDVLDYQRLEMTYYWLRQMQEVAEVATTPIDLASPAFAPFREETYAKLKHIHNFEVANGMDAALWVEALREAGRRDATPVTYGNFRPRVLALPQGWQLDYLRDHFDPAVYAQHLGALEAWGVTMDDKSFSYADRLEQIEPTPYTRALAHFQKLMEDGTRAEAGLDADSLVLDAFQLQALLDRHAHTPLLVNFWSSQFAGSTLVDNIPLMKDFVRRNDGKMAVVNVCVDSLVRKDLWAARIMESDWTGAHYFVPIEGNPDLLKRFSDRNLHYFCEGGANYALVDAQGKISGDIPLPFHKLAEEIIRDARE